MTRDEVIDKIKKLLRMKRGGTIAEVETALNLARELAQKHGIDLDGVNPDDEQQDQDKPIDHEDAYVGGRLQWEIKYAALIAQQFFNVSIFTRRRTAVVKGWPTIVAAMTFVGTEWDRQIGIYVFRFLVGHFRREWKTKRGRCRNRQAFMYGMYVGLGTKLRERQPARVAGPGLMRIERSLARRDVYLKKHFPAIVHESARPDGDADAAKYRGYLAGRDTEIRPAVTDRNAQGQMLLQ